MTWHYGSISKSLSAIEFSIVNRDLLSYVEIDKTECFSDRVIATTNYFVNRNGRHYIFSASMEMFRNDEDRFNTTFEITSLDRKIVEDEISRVRARVDDVIRFRRRKLEQEVTG